MENTAVTAEKSRPRIPTLTAISSLEAFRQGRSVGLSLREAARAAELSCSTLRRLDTPLKTEFSPAVICFLQSPEGWEFLTRIVHSVVFVFVVYAGLGVKTFVHWLEESGLSSLVASSYGTWRGIVTEMETKVNEVCSAERMTLAEKMRPKSLTIGLDETFFPEMVLVCADAVSGFLFFETFSEKRDSVSWERAWSKATEGFKVTVKQAVADGGTGIRGFVEGTLGAHRSPDLFHVLHDVCKGFALFLARREDLADERRTAAHEALGILREVEDERMRNPRRGRKPDFRGQQMQARGVHASACRELQVAEERREEFRAILHSISQAHFPISLADGTRKGESILRRELEEAFARLIDLADRVALPESLRSYVTKAERVIPALVETLAFFSQEAEKLVAEARLSPSAAHAFHSFLVPAAVLQRIASLTQDSVERTRLKELGQQKARDGYSRMEIDPVSNEGVRLMQLAERVAHLWQRSSSAIEGRNGLLSLRHHSLKGLSERKLLCLSNLHNFYIRRKDGTTAANRFFGQEHIDVMRVVLEKMDPLPMALRKRKGRNESQAA